MLPSSQKFNVVGFRPVKFLIFKEGMHWHPRQELIQVGKLPLQSILKLLEQKEHFLKGKTIGIPAGSRWNDSPNKCDFKTEFWLTLAIISKQITTGLPVHSTTAHCQGKECLDKHQTPSSAGSRRSWWEDISKQWNLFRFWDHATGISSHLTRFWSLHN